MACAESYDARRSCRWSKKPEDPDRFAQCSPEGLPHLLGRAQPAHNPHRPGDRDYPDQFQDNTPQNHCIYLIKCTKFTTSLVLSRAFSNAPEISVTWAKEK